jgi:hypothetical protein
VYRGYPIVAVLDDRFVGTDADDLVTAVGETSRDGRSDVPTPDVTDVYLLASIQPSALRSLISSDQFHTESTPSTFIIGLTTISQCKLSYSPPVKEPDSVH